LKKSIYLAISLCLIFGVLLSQDTLVPPKIEDEISIKLRKFEEKTDYAKNSREILEYDHAFVEEIIFKKLNQIENKKPEALSHILTILGEFDTPRALLTLSKFTTPYLDLTEKDKPIVRPRHLRVTAINAILKKVTPDRTNIIIKLISDNDPIFQCIVLKLLKEKEVKESVVPAFEVFKKPYSDDTLSVKTEAASLILTISNDPQIKNSVLLNMLMEPNIHIRKAGLTLFTAGGLPGDAEVRRKLLDLLKTAKLDELELACKAAGTIQLLEAKDELLLILNREKSPFTKWECINSLYKINYDINEIYKLINDLIQKYKVNEQIVNADQERFMNLLNKIKTEKEQK
jgi:hypothetical protein